MKNTATIFNIQKYTVHDGPGIRTALFFKGCPLKCLWCSNPESQKYHPEIAVYKKDCIGVEKCGRCIHACPYNGEEIFRVEDGKVASIDRSKCKNCLICEKACPNTSLKVFGKEYTLQELMKIILEDMSFYAKSGGGITCSGGDPIMQYPFLQKLFRECKRYGIHVCLETELFCKKEAIDAVFPYVDLWFTDIKTMDNEKHRAYTGVPVDRILDNIEYIVSCGGKIIIRTPVVPGYNNDDKNIHEVGRFVSDRLKNQIVQYQLLPYRVLGTDKYDALGIAYPMGDMKQPQKEEYGPNLLHLAEELKKFGVPAAAGSNVPYEYRDK